MKILFKIFLFLTFGYWLLASPSPALAQDRQDCIDAMGSDKPVNICKFSQDNINSVFTNLGCEITGCRTSDTDELTHTGALPPTSQFLARILTNPPVRASEWVADVMNNTGLAGDAYAQGIGFSALTPVLPIWKAFRNISYFLFIIVFVVIGFMIMFRSNIDPQTVVTVQAALPKMIITLLLITFSYAIAGLVVDMIYLTIFIATSLFEAFGILQSAATARDALFGHSIVRIGISYFLAPGEATGGAANAITDIVAGAFSVGTVLEWLAGGLVYLVVAVAVLIAVFRTLFSLIFSYIGIIVSTIFAPIQLLTNAFPGANTFSGWLKGLIANAAVFPAVAIMILIGVALIGQPFNPDESLGIAVNPDVGYGEAVEGRGFIPPLITTGTDQTGVDAVRAIIGIGIIMLLPEVAKAIKEALGVKNTLGELAGEGLKRGIDPVRTITGINLATNLAKQTGGYIVSGMALGGAENAVDRVSKFVPKFKEKINTLKINMERTSHKTKPATPGQVDEYGNQFQGEVPKTPEP